MALIKLLFIFAIATLALAGYPQYGHDDHHADYYSHPKYTYDYGVKDGHTGDHKSQWESRDGDHVKGGYTLDEADGTKRVVEYTSDKHGGLNAVVKRIGHAVHPQHYHVESGHGHGYDGHGHGYDGHGQGYDGHGHGHGHASSYANLNQHHGAH